MRIKHMLLAALWLMLSTTLAHAQSADQIMAAELAREKAMSEGWAADRAAKHAASCEASFPERLRDTQAKIRRWHAEQVAYDQWAKSPKGQAYQFYMDHCRQLNGLEIAVRRLDDLNSFVCDQPKPKILTARLLMESPGLVADGTVGNNDNIECRALDQQSRVSLVVSNATDELENAIAQGLILCFQDSSPVCDDIRAKAAK
jgi:hypothetical protein